MSRTSHFVLTLTLSQLFVVASGVAQADEDTDKVKKFVATLKAAKKSIEEFKNTFDDPAEAQHAFDKLANGMRDRVKDAGSETTVSGLRDSVRRGLGQDMQVAIPEDKLERAFQEYDKIKGAIKTLFDDESTVVDDWKSFYTDVADVLSPSAEPDEESPTEELGSSNLEDAFETLKKKIELDKYYAADAEKHRETVNEYVQLLKTIQRESYANVTEMKKETKRRTHLLIDALVRGTKPKSLWKTAYEGFERWADGSNLFDTSTSEGWSQALTRLSKLLLESVDAYDSDVEEAHKALYTTQSPASAGGYGSTSYGGGATLGAVWHARRMAHMRYRFERNAARIRAISGGN